MSDISVLTQEYETTSQLSETIDRALIELKKVQAEARTSTSNVPTPIRRLGRAVGIALASEHQQQQGDVGTAHDSSDILFASLADLLEQLATTIDFSDASSSKGYIDADESAMRIPLALAMRLREERRGDLEYLLDDIKGAAARLKHGTDAVTRDDMNLLDDLASVADAQATALYRRLMRR